jgi:adenine-specific DNA-methyltransferase
MGSTTLRKITRAKAEGIHYTPPDLAKFLAEAVWEQFVPRERPVRVLDPACGDGALLRAIAETAPACVRAQLVLVGYEKDAAALARAGHNLSCLSGVEMELEPVDFLSSSDAHHDGNGHEPSLFHVEGEATRNVRQFDIVIANPPYVRTQVLGAKIAQELARRFHLKGRVDLYHAFIKAMTSVLRRQGLMGLLTSNRFLFVQSGAATRKLLTADFDLRAIYDLGDTKLFTASVLPVIVTARKGSSDVPHACAFHRVYEDRTSGDRAPAHPLRSSLLDAVRSDFIGKVVTPNGRFVIERGILAPRPHCEAPWALQTPESRKWLATVRAHQACTFGDVARIRVGIKTTADGVFIRRDWHLLPRDQQPEAELLRPILTHQDAARWCISAEQLGQRRVLYPHVSTDGKRQAVRLDAYPRARAYLEGHRPALMRRKYVLDAGRQWYELWVPQDPDAWSRPKLVFPDIAERPCFFLDRSGAVVDGDCYWSTLKPEKDAGWLLLMLAVANSSFIAKYYDTLFHNKLYSGRRRFMMQYVKEFPLPRRDARATKHMIGLVSKMVGETNDTPSRRARETEIDDAVWASFGLSKEIPR